MNEVAYLVELEFERVQTHLFEVPELRAMAGANARLGETLRGRLTETGFADGESLPALARKPEHGAALPSGVTADTFPDATGVADPLQASGNDVDDPLRGGDGDPRPRWRALSCRFSR